MIDKNKIKWLRGGLGDILLKLGNIKPDEFYIVFSHLKQSVDLVSMYTSNYKYKEMIGLVGSVPNEVEHVTYPPVRIPDKCLQKAKNILSPNKTIIGIHPIGSKPSRDYDIRIQRPQKLMSDKFINSLLEELGDDDVEFLLFCAPDEVYLYENMNVRIVAEPYIWDCIAFVSFCDLVIAVDSAIKTFSAVQHISTVVVMGDYEDEYRERFIDPYKEIVPIKFTDMDLVIGEVILQAKKLLKDLEVHAR